MNITEVIKFWKQQKDANNKNGILLFIDLRKAYDWVNRNILLQKWVNLGLPCNFIQLLGDIFSKTMITFDEQHFIKTNRGLLQGSCLSPILFNIYINDLLIKIEMEGFMIKAYADDVVIGLKHHRDLPKCIQILREWGEYNKIEINPNKSGILRILKHKGKLKEFKNDLNIPEVFDYLYLGINIDQSLRFSKECSKLKSREIHLKNWLRKLDLDIISFKTKLLLFKTVLYQIMNYPMISLFLESNNFRRQFTSTIYRMLKFTFKMKGNPNISKTLELFNLKIEDFVQYRKESINNKILSLPWPQKPIFKWNLKSFWSSNILNFALGTNIKYYVVKEWKWGNKLNQRQLLFECPFMYLWRKETWNILKVLNIQEFKEILSTFMFQNLSNSKIKEIEQVISNFYSWAKFTYISA